MTIDEWWRSLRSVFFKQTEYIHSTFDVRRSSVSFSIKLAVFLASGVAYMKLVASHWSLALVTGYWFLVTGHWLLVSGYWSLVTGFWLLVTGYWFLVAGYWLLVT